MYKWARTAGLSTADPCAGVENIDTSSAGFRVWTTADLHRFFSHHPPGTTARLTLQLALWTGLRRGDICRLSRAMIKSVDGIEYLSVDTEKTGAIVEIPIMPPLRQAIASPPAGDFVFLLNRLGRPYSKEVLGNEFREWCKEAGVSGRLHGIRKALGGLLADAGCSSYEIAAILGHEKISTTEIYTKTANRRRLARDGFEKLRGLEW
jgi:integrase